MIGFAIAYIGIVSRTGSCGEVQSHALSQQCTHVDTPFGFQGRGILLGLEMLVAGDIIRTVAIAPTFTIIGGCWP